jgi:UDP-N-acetylmuramyl pentapeptide phosphotransferase/UDP-N-acetylglucosamine-1-phosphate transferase
MLVAFLLGLALGGPYIRLLRDLRIGKSIRAEGPQSHFAKQGTPTMGGALVIAVVFLLWGALLAFLPDDQLSSFIPQTIVPMGALLTPERARQRSGRADRRRDVDRLCR